MIGGKGFKALHTLSAYATTARLALAQLSVPEKTNEITAIPDLLDHLAETNQLEGALVTIDAMGCQVDIAETIVAHKAEYLLALKGNQPNLEAEVADYFRDAPDTKLVAKTTVEKGHGRIETRTYSASSKVDWINSERSYPGQTRFTDIKTLVKVDSRVEHADRTAPKPATSSVRRPSTSSGSPRPYAVIGASKACIGCSTSNSAMTCHATGPVTAPKIWPSSAASPSILSVSIRPREASKHDASEQAGAPPSC
jgi:predicted transposase YbfD/YdcC